MTSLKTKNICFLAAFLFLSIVPTLAEVVNSVSKCKGFLLGETPPDIQHVFVKGTIQDQNRYRIICQIYDNVPRFLTVYDINNKIPVFSAYKYRESVGGRPSVTWMIEPQLENNADPKDINMRTGGHNIYNNQAVNADYDNQHPHIYDKGHLFPVSHAPTQDDQISTFTLTNSVPQHLNFNRGRWKTMEQNMRNTMNPLINRNSCFVVVGAQPGKNNLNNRVNIPSVMWSAFYCTDRTSGAYWSNNDDVGDLHEVTLQDLINVGIVAFPRAP